MKTFESNGTSPYKARSSSTSNVKFSLKESSDDVEVKLSKDGLHAQFNFMLGRLKTVLDATVSNPVQNKALKDLVSQEVWHRYNYILDVTGVGGRIISDGNVEIS